MPRYLRGLLATALGWGAVWGAASAALGEPLAGVACGALAGAGFAALLARAERRRTVDGIRYSRVVLWGALGGLALPAALLASAVGLHGGGAFWLDRALVAGAVSGACGGLTAVAMLALARRGRRVDPHVVAT
jgi:hypothetical protein